MWRDGVNHNPPPHISDADAARATFEVMKAKQIGKYLASFYETWAAFEAGAGAEDVRVWHLLDTSPCTPRRKNNDGRNSTHPLY